MSRKSASDSPKPVSAEAAARADRLKAALKANMARRKAQAKARVAKPDDDATAKTEK